LHPVEWVSVMRRQLCRILCVVTADRQQFKSVGKDRLNDPLREGQLPDRCRL
jgi:hypothetical protein